MGESERGSKPSKFERDALDLGIISSPLSKKDRLLVITIPKVWELLKSFKERCQSRGWKTSKHEDWVKVGNEYHNLLWIRMIRPSVFEKVATRHRCAIREGTSYQVVDVSYTAWLLPETPPKKMIQMVTENPEISKRTALYDLSYVYKGKPICLKLNKTDSIVFQEFERFLEDKWGVELKPAYK